MFFLISRFYSQVSRKQKHSRAKFCLLPWFGRQSISVFAGDPFVTAQYHWEYFLPKKNYVHKHSCCLSITGFPFRPFFCEGGRCTRQNILARPFSSFESQKTIYKLKNYFKKWRLTSSVYKAINSMFVHVLQIFAKRFSIANKCNSVNYV